MLAWAAEARGSPTSSRAPPDLASLARGLLHPPHGQLDAIMERPELSDAGEHRDVLEAYRMFAHDRGWLRRIEEAVAVACPVPDEVGALIDVDEAAGQSARLDPGAIVTPVKPA